MRAKDLDLYPHLDLLREHNIQNVNVHARS
jgi:hypothetical protein